MKIICPHCHQEIETNLRETYYSKHKEEILARYKERMKDPAFAQHRREIALRSHNRKKGIQHGTEN